MKSAGVQSSADFSAAKPHLATLNDEASPLLKITKRKRGDLFDKKELRVQSCTLYG